MTITEAIQPKMKNPAAGLNVDYIIQRAWQEYDSTRSIISITDISARVSTNHVYRIRFSDDSFIIAKLSYYGDFAHFTEDHSIIDTLSNNLPAPFENFLARALAKGKHLFIYHHNEGNKSAWVVFYRPIQIKQKLPRRLDETQIVKLAKQVALFHKACYSIRNTLPPSSKTLATDMNSLLHMLDTQEGYHQFYPYNEAIRKHADLFLQNTDNAAMQSLTSIPVFVDWNIGNFSVTSSLKLFSRWDYDWFRTAPRIMDFYFLSRVCSNVGDRTVFTYNASTLMEDRFLLFLQHYHEVYPLTETEILFLKEAYRFFILNYVVKDGRHFFRKSFADKLQREALEVHLPSLDRTLQTDVILKALNL